jgi:integrase
VDIIRQIALTGCLRSEIIGLMWSEVDADACCLRLADSKEGASIRPIGLPVVEFLEARRRHTVGSYMGRTTPSAASQTIGSNCSESSLTDITPHVLRHYVSFLTMSGTLGLALGFPANSPVTGDIVLAPSLSPA